MKKKIFTMIAIAIFFGGTSILAADYWLENNIQTVVKEIPNPIATPVKPEQTIVVAGAALNYGAAVTKENLRQVAWAADTMPEGAFKTIDEMLKDGERAALGAIELGEPILASRITGAGARPTLSTLLSPGMRAVAIPVDVIAGVSGFIVPNDRVDVMIVRNFDNESGNDMAAFLSNFPNARKISGQDNQTIVIARLMPNIRVLSVDQVADDRQAAPVVAASAAIEVSPAQASLVAAAQVAGRLTLQLRRAGEADDPLMAEIGSFGIDDAKTSAFEEKPDVPEKRTAHTVRVRTNNGSQTFEVAIEELAQ